MITTFEEYIPIREAAPNYMRLSFGDQPLRPEAGVKL